jgi:hypothetical protein
MIGEPLNVRPLNVPVHATPEVEGPNSMPTGSRFDTSTEPYAAGFPSTPTVTESASRARANRLSGQATRIIRKLTIPAEESSSYYET